MNRQMFVNLIADIFSVGMDSLNNEYNYAYQLVKLRERKAQEFDEEQLESIDALIFFTEHRFDGDNKLMRNGSCWASNTFIPVIIEDA